MGRIAKLKKEVNKEKEPFKISEENAIKQMAKLIEYYEVDLDNISDDEDGNDEVIIDNLVDAIMRGRIEIKEDGKDIPVLTQITVKGERLNYSNNIANARANLDFKDQKHFKANYQFAGALCGIGEDGIRSLDRKDSRVAEYISSFFLKL